MTHETDSIMTLCYNVADSMLTHCQCSELDVLTAKTTIVFVIIIFITVVALLESDKKDTQKRIN